MSNPLCCAGGFADSSIRLHQLRTAAGSAARPSDNVDAGLQELHGLEQERESLARCLRGHSGAQPHIDCLHAGLSAAQPGHVHPAALLVAGSCSGLLWDTFVSLAQALRATLQPQGPAHVCRQHAGNVTSLGYSPCGQLMMSGSTDCTARLWSPALAAGLAVLRCCFLLQHSTQNCRLPCCPCPLTCIGIRLPPQAGRPRLAFQSSVSACAHASITCVTAFTLLGPCCRGHASPVWDVAFSPLSPYAATASADHTAHVWSTELAKPLRILTGAACLMCLSVCQTALGCKQVCKQSPCAGSRLHCDTRKRCRTQHRRGGGAMAPQRALSGHRRRQGAAPVGPALWRLRACAFWACRCSTHTPAKARPALA